jgi:hypothetical protein
MDKKGLIGKILLGILILVLIIFTVVGVTAYQASKVLSVVKEETSKIQHSSELLAEQKDCKQINEIETSVGKIEREVLSACKNPLLKFAISSVESIPVKCETLPTLKKDFENKFVEAKEYCENPDKFNESITDGSLSREELVALAQKYGIEI